MFQPLDLSDPHTLLYIKTIGYSTLFVLMILEGPIVTILGAFLSSLGFFNVFVVLFLSFSGDIIGDIILYAIGYHGGSKILEKAQKFLKIKTSHIEKLRRYFERHGKKTIFSVKSTTGLCWITFILAGTIKMPFRDFVISSILGGVVWSSFLVISGYFFGYAFEKINEYIKTAGIIIIVLAFSFYALLLLYKKYQTTRLLENGNGNKK